jgi:hypothetical protein
MAQVSTGMGKAILGGCILGAAALTSEVCYAGLVTVTPNNPLEVSFRDLPFISSNPDGYVAQGGVAITLDTSNQLDAGESLILELFNDESFVSAVSFGAIGNQIVLNSPTDGFGVAVIDAFQSGVGAIRLTAVGTSSVTLKSVYVQIISPGSWTGGFIAIPAPAAAPLFALAGLTAHNRRRK